MSRAAAQAPTFYQGTYHGRPDQVSRVRAAVARHLGDCPAADDAVLIVSELAGNAVLHSASAGDFFTVRCELFPAYVWIECELRREALWVRVEVRDLRRLACRSRSA